MTSLDLNFSKDRIKIEKKNGGRIILASIRDVAKLAKVAPSTVSLVLNNSGYVAEKTRAKVRRAMEELQYVPNELARNLYKKRTNMIGVIVPDISHPFFGTFVRFLEMELYDNGYTTMICSTAQKVNGEREFIERLKRRMMDGIVMGAHSLDLRVYADVERPIVALDRILDDRIPVVRADHRMGGVLAAERFLRRGCGKVVQLMGARNVTTPAHEHHFSFAKELRARHVRVETMELGWNQFGPEYYQVAARELFERYPDADGVFGADLVICACLQRARQLGIQVPDQMGMIAYDGTYLTRMGERTITAVVQPIDLLARLAAQRILGLVSGEALPILEVPGVSLQEGETC